MGDFASSNLRLEVAGGGQRAGPDNHTFGVGGRSVHNGLEGRFGLLYALAGVYYDIRPSLFGIEGLDRLAVIVGATVLAVALPPNIEFTGDRWLHILYAGASP
ncbi:MAG: hypothetical protein GKS00_01920 [Alphaproteobacteria bacterium]|nr:hypothetical protein [Alphaproteobacteria bacterium]